MDQNENNEISWGRKAVEHLAGMAIIGSVAAGCGAAVALQKGWGVASSMKMLGGMGFVSGLGMGRTAYAAIMPNSSAKSKSWQERISSEKAERDVNSMRQPGR